MMLYRGSAVGLMWSQVLRGGSLHNAWVHAGVEQ